MRRVAVACDHAGFHLKDGILTCLNALGFETIDLGAFQFDPSDDYPDFARAAGLAIQSGRADRAVVVCGSGVGASIAANKMIGIRAAMCHDTYSARQGVEHDDMNVLCLGGRVIGDRMAFEVVEAFVRATYTGEERHERRLEKVRKMEAENLAGQTQGTPS